MSDNMGEEGSTGRGDGSRVADGPIGNSTPRRSSMVKVMGLAAATAVAIGAGAWGAVALLGGDNEPAASPGSSASSSPASASPSPDSTSQGEHWGDITGLAAPGEVTVDPFLPDALPLPDGLLADTERGWVLATYSPIYLPAEYTEWNPVADVQVVYLVSPEGERYQVLELDHRRPMELLAWNAGDDHVIVRDERSYQKSSDAVDPEEGWFSLDLSTGTVEPISLEIPEDVWPAGVTAAGLRLWVTFEWQEEEGSTTTLYVTDLDGALINEIELGGGVFFREDQTATGGVDPSGDRIAWTRDRGLTLVGLRDGVTDTVAMEVPEGRACVFSTWLDEDRVLVLCAVPDDTWELSLEDRDTAFYEVEISSGETIERMGSIDGCQHFLGFLVGEVPFGQLECETPSGAPGDDTGAYTFDGISLDPVPELQAYAFFETSYGTQSVYFSRDEVMGDVLYGRFGGISNDGGSATLIRWDSSNHEVTVLIPGHGHFPIDGTWILRDITSVVVAQ